MEQTGEGVGVLGLAPVLALRELPAVKTVSLWLKDFRRGVAIKKPSRTGLGFIWLPLADLNCGTGLGINSQMLFP